MALEEGRLTRPDRPVSRAPSAGSLADLRPWRDHLPSGDGRPASSLTSAGTLVAAWLSRCASAPAQPLWLEGDGERSGCCTNEQFEEDTRRMAGRLLHAGLEPGDRVLWSCQASIAALVANVACLRAGLVVVPASTADTEPEVASVVRLTRPRAAVVDDDARARWVRRAAGPSTIVVGPSVDLPGSPASESSIDRSRPEDPALVGLTSGSTGAPKGAALSHGNLLAGAEALRWAWRWEADDRLLHCLPLFHAHGLCVGVYGTMVAGASAVLLGRFDPERVAAAARDDRATLFFGVPTMYRRLLGSGRAPDLRGLRLCVSGSAPLEPDLHAEASAAIGAPVLERYGMTEALMVTSNPCEGERRPGTVGFPLPGVEVRLDPLSAPSPSHPSGQRPGELGEVLVRGPAVFGGYVGEPSATAAAFSEDEDGRRWFRTGDLGVVEDGYLAIRGRAKELIITGGHNVHPQEVEAALAGCPGVAEVAVAGTASEDLGEVVTAWVVPDGAAPSLEDLLRFTAGTLAPYKRPRRLEVVDALPRTALGKLQRSRLGAEDDGAAG